MFVSVGTALFRHVTQEKKLFLLELSKLLRVSQPMEVMCIMGNTTDKLVLK